LAEIVGNPEAFSYHESNSSLFALPKQRTGWEWRLQRSSMSSDDYKAELMALAPSLGSQGAII
jgi:hypothetical protein